VAPDDVLGNSVLPVALNLPCISYNRSKFSQPQDVHKPEAGAKPAQNGIATLVAKRIPSAVFMGQGDKSNNYKLWLMHDPIECNYAHTELRVCNEHDPPTKPLKREPKSGYMNRLIRERIVERMSIHVPPTPLQSGAAT
jgi:hypothetical protein